jgi:peptide/nickel transport system permease protein
MALFLVKRLLSAALAVVAVASITWMIVHGLRPEVWAFDERPVLEQFLHYLERVFLHFDMDGFAEENTELTQFVKDTVPQDLQLLVGATVFALAVGIGGGVWCAMRPRSLAARAAEAVAFFFLCAPVYVVGLMLILLFGAGIGLVADFGALMPAKYVEFNDNPLRWFGSMLFPWIVLGLPLAAFCLRMTSAVMRENFDEHYIRTAEMKGLSPREIARRHVLPASVAPVFGVTSVSVPIIITNLVLVEQVFSVPGIFQNTYEALDDGNFLLLQSMVLVGAVFVAGMSMLFDIALAALDPRVRLSEPRSSS